MKDVGFKAKKREKITIVVTGKRARKVFPFLHHREKKREEKRLISLLIPSLSKKLPSEGGKKAVTTRPRKKEGNCIQESQKTTHLAKTRRKRKRRRKSGLFSFPLFEEQTKNCDWTILRGSFFFSPSYSSLLDSV